jgi:hypothetical protein
MSPKNMLTPVVVFALSLTVFAQEKSDVQSAARPYDLDIAGPVMIAGSDEASKQFQYETLPSLLEYSKKYFSDGQGYRDEAEIAEMSEKERSIRESEKERYIKESEKARQESYEKMQSVEAKAAEAKDYAEAAEAAREDKEGKEVKEIADFKPVKSGSATFLDPSKLVLGADYAARAYFLGENSKYSNTLGFSTTGGSPFSKDAALIFPDATSPDAYQKPYRNESTPLLAGDFVELGKFQKGTQLDFFLIANGGEKAQGYFSTDSSRNEDGMRHAVVMALDGSPYLLIGFNDIMKGGDKGFDNLVFAIDIGMENMKLLTSGLGAPEPSLAAGGILALCTIFGRKRRR